MNIFRGRGSDGRRLPAEFLAQDIAVLSGLSSGRISQLGAAGRLPAPDTRIGGKPAWSRRLVLQWLEGEGREPRLPVSPLLRGRHRRVGTQVVTLAARDSRWGGVASEPVRVHVATYEAERSGGIPAPVFLCVVLAPHTSLELLGISNVFAQLVDAVSPDLLSDGGRRADAVTGTYVIVGTDSYDESRSSTPDLRPQVQALDLLSTTPREQLYDVRGLSSGLSAEEIAEGLGHPLPWWPPGCATAELVAAWTPGADPVACPAPPPLHSAWRIRGWGHHVAETLPSEEGAAVRKAVDTQWATRLSWFVDDAAPVDPPWARAITIEGNRYPAGVEFIEGLEVLFSRDGLDLHHCSDLQDYFGDPDYATGGVLEIAQLTPQLREHVTTAVTLLSGAGSQSWRAHRVRRLLDGDVSSATWRARGAAIPAALTSTHVAFLVPRAAPLLPAGLTESGAELVIAPTAADGPGQARQLSALLHLDDGSVIPLGAGPAPLLAGTLTWWAWHTDEDLPLATGVLHGLARESSALREMTAAIAASGASPSVLPWATVVALAGPHPPAGRAWCACSRSLCERSTSAEPAVGS